METCYGEEKSGFPVQPEEKIRKNRVVWSTYRESSYHTLITALFLIFRIFFSHLRARTAEYYSYATSKSWSPALTNAWLLRKCRTTYIIECIILLTGPRSGHSVLISKIPLLSEWHTNIVQDCKLLSERLSESTCNLSHCSSYLVTRDNPGDALVLKQKYNPEKWQYWNFQGALKLWKITASFISLHWKRQDNSNSFLIAATTWSYEP